MQCVRYLSILTDRGRRRLDFKRFQGKSMFLDLPGYRQVAWLEEELTSRGAVSDEVYGPGWGVWIGTSFPT